MRLQHCDCFVYGKRLSTDSDEDISRELDERQELTINAGQLVWAVAISSNTTFTKPRSTCLNWASKNVDRAVLAAGLQSGAIKVWDLKTGHPLLECCDHKDVVRDMSFAPDGSLRLMSASRDGTLRLWQLKGIISNHHKKKQVVSVSLSGSFSKWLYACRWSPDSKTVVAVGDCASVVLYSIETCRVLRRLEGHKNDVYGCDFSPDGALLVTCSYDMDVFIWDPHIGSKLFQLRHIYPSPRTVLPVAPIEGFVRGVSFSHDGRHIATISDDSYVRFWDIYNPSVPCQIAVVINALYCRYSPDGSVLAVGTRHGTATFWLAVMQAPSLQHICRLSIRRVLSTEHIDCLKMPSRLKEFLRYATHL